MTPARLGKVMALLRPLLDVGRWRGETPPYADGVVAFASDGVPGSFTPCFSI